MLCQAVCKQCRTKFYTEQFEIQKESRSIFHDQVYKEKFFEGRDYWFITDWLDRRVTCHKVKTRTLSIDGEPPDTCEFKLEHLVSS